MKKSKALLIIATSFLLLAACDNSNDKTSSSSNAIETTSEVNTASEDSKTSVETTSEADATLEDLKTAIESLGKNYTLNSVSYDGSTGKTVVSENYFGTFMDSGQISGYMKVSNDNDTVHSYLYYPESATNEWDGFDDYGREDYLPLHLSYMKDLDHVLDLDTFVKTKDKLTFHTDDEFSIQRLLNLTNHPLAYYFGHAHGGIDISLNEDLSLDQIKFLGFNPDMLDGGILSIPKDNVFYRITVGDIGTSRIDYVHEYANGEMDIKDPELYMLLRVGEEGNALYEGVEIEFTGILSSILDMGNSATVISDGVPTYFPDASVLDPWSNYSKEITVKGTVDVENGAVVFKDAELVSIGDEMEIEPYEIFDVSTWEEEFADSYNGSKMNGMSINLSLTYIEGEVTTSGASSLKCQINSSTPIDVKFSEGLDEEMKQAYLDFVDEEGIASGDSIDFGNLTFKWENGPVVYVGETSSFSRSMTFGSLCMDVLGMEIPEPVSFDGWNIMYEDSGIIVDEETIAEGVFAIAYIKEEGVATFAEEYGELLVAAGFEFVKEFEDTDGDMRYVYQKDNIVVRFTSPFNTGSDDDVEYRMWIEAYDLDRTSPNVE